MKRLCKHKLACHLLPSFCPVSVSTDSFTSLFKKLLQDICSWILNFRRKNLYAPTCTWPCKKMFYLSLCTCKLCTDSCVLQNWLYFADFDDDVQFAPEDVMKNLYIQDDEDTDDDDESSPFTRMARKMEDITPNKDGGVFKKILQAGTGNVIPSGSIVTSKFNAVKVQCRWLIRRKWMLNKLLPCVRESVTL